MSICEKVNAPRSVSALPSGSGFRVLRQLDLSDGSSRLFARSINQAARTIFRAPEHRQKLRYPARPMLQLRRAEWQGLRPETLCKWQRRAQMKLPRELVSQ